MTSKKQLYMLIRGVCVLIRTECRASNMLGKLYTTKLYPQGFRFCLIDFSVLATQLIVLYLLFKIKLVINRPDIIYCPFMS